MAYTTSSFPPPYHLAHQPEDLEFNELFSQRPTDLSTAIFCRHSRPAHVSEDDKISAIHLTADSLVLQRQVAWRAVAFFLIMACTGTMLLGLIYNTSTGARTFRNFFGAVGLTRYIGNHIR